MSDMPCECVSMDACGEPCGELEEAYNDIERHNRVIAADEEIKTHLGNTCDTLAARIEKLESQLESGMNGQSMLPTELLDGMHLRIEKLEAERKSDCVEFFRWFWNAPGTNADQGYDAWREAIADCETTEKDAEIARLNVSIGNLKRELRNARCDFPHTGD